VKVAACLKPARPPDSADPRRPEAGRPDQPPGSHPAAAWPEDCPAGKRRTTVPCGPRPTGLLGPAGEQAGDLGDDARQHGKPQRQHDGAGARQRVAIAGGGDGSGRAGLPRQLPRRLRLAPGSRTASPPEASRRAMTGPGRPCR
jgi:hypothetical protein